MTLSPDDLITILDGCYSERQELVERIRSETETGKQSTIPAQQSEYIIMEKEWQLLYAAVPKEEEGILHKIRSRPHIPVAPASTPLKIPTSDEINHELACFGVFQDCHRDDCEYKPLCNYKAAISRAAADAATLAALKELKTDLETRFIPSSNQWSKGRNSGLIECCNIIDDHVRQSTTAGDEPKQSEKPITPNPDNLQHFPFDTCHQGDVPK